MSSDRNVTNVVLAGLGGQGILKASDILADAAFRAGLDVKKSEVHGMSQRGGSVTSDVRFGHEVMSPMIPSGEVDYLLVAAPEHVQSVQPLLRKGGVLITPELFDPTALSNKRSVNIALLGILSMCLDIPETDWLAAIRSNLAENLHEANLQAFVLGRSVGTPIKGSNL